MNKNKSQKILIPALLVQFISATSFATETILSPQQIAKEQKKLISLDMDALLNTEVTSVTKKAQKISEAAAAIFVISNEDIKRSGVTTIPEALRMVPGIDVAHIDGNKWAISSRGFNDRFSNKLLVLIDGRSVYTPFFSGVNWDIQDTLLEDVERIEVIRGSGASLWGANAVNGVINIITKKAEDTQGTYLMAGTGTKERLFGGFRYGGQIGDNAHYRIYGKYFERENNQGFQNQFINDDWQGARGGFRLDWDSSVDDQITMQGDIYETKSGETISYPNLATLSNILVNHDADSLGGNILFNWSHKIADDNQTSLKVYYDYTQKDTFWLRKEHSTLDIDFQHAFSPFESHKVIWGAGYRFISDDIEGSYMITPLESQTDVHLFSFFLQDEISLIENELTLILGSKLEHNDYSGFEIQPNARLIWNPTESQTLWASVSRAVRTSTRAEQGGRINQRFFKSPTLPAPGLAVLTGSIGEASEELIAYELGYRFIPDNDWSVDVALFYNDYDNLRNFQPQRPFLENNHFVFPATIHTDMTAESYGVELATTWQVLDNWRINASYSYLQMQLHMENGDANLSENIEDKSPHHKFSILSSVNLLPNLEWDMWLKYVDNVPAFNIPSYLTLDSRLSWHITDTVELTVVGQNLLDSHHPEFDNEFILMQPSQVERSVYGKVSIRF